MKIYDYQWFILSWMPLVFFMNAESFVLGLVVSIGLIAKILKNNFDIDKGF